MSTLLSMKALREVCLQPTLHVANSTDPNYTEELEQEHLEALESIRRFFDALRSFTFTPGPGKSPFYLSLYSGPQRIEATRVVNRFGSRSSTHASYHYANIPALGFTILCRRCKHQSIFRCRVAKSRLPGGKPDGLRVETVFNMGWGWRIGWSAELKREHICWV
jgi:hypothetical protein